MDNCSRSPVAYLSPELLKPLASCCPAPDRLVPGVLKVGKGLCPGGPSQTPFVSQTEALSTSEEAAGQVVQPQEPGLPPSGPAEPCRLAICFHSHLVKARVLWSVHHIAAPELLSGEGGRRTIYFNLKGSSGGRFSHLTLGGERSLYSLWWQMEEGAEGVGAGM